jgi:hypothetical protein
MRDRDTLIARITEGPGTASAAERRAAFANAGLGGALASLIGKVAQHAYRVTDADVAAARATGQSEDQLFELVVCAAVGQATRQHDAALAALDAAMAPNRE